VRALAAVLRQAAEQLGGIPFGLVGLERDGVVVQLDVTFDGVPKWVCMTDGAGYYAKDILPRFDPRYTLVEYVQDNPVPA
jgi:hypothetical protein